MREQGVGTLFPPPPLIERKKATVKVNGKDVSTEGRRRLSTGGYVNNSSYGGKFLLSNGNGGMPSGSCGRLKGGSSSSAAMSLPNSNGNVRHYQCELLSERTLKADTESSFSSAKRKPAADDGALPQWGHGKRSRCSRFESSKHASSSPTACAVVLPPEESASKPASPLEKRALGNGDSVTKPRSHGLPKCSGMNPVAVEGAAARNSVINKNTHGLLHIRTGSNGADESRKHSGEVKDKGTPLQKNTSRDHSSIRQTQRSEGMEPAPVALGSSNGNVKHSSRNSGAALSSSDATATACDKSKADVQTLEWPRFVLSLTRKEKEEDFLIIKGTKIPQRPKKRPKVVEKAILFCTPGNWLSDLSRGRYDVREKKPVKKRPRGLKAMESMDSDSD